MFHHKNRNTYFSMEAFNAILWFDLFISSLKFVQYYIDIIHVVSLQQLNVEVSLNSYFSKIINKMNT